MVYKVPNAPDVSDINQSEPDNGDFVALGARGTGVVSGGAVTALGTPTMAVQVSAANVVINDVPYSHGSGTASIGAATSNPRFDLVGWTSDGLAVVAGAPTTNPRYPEFDPTLFCPAAAVYVRPGVSTIVALDIVPKAPGQSGSFQRNYALDTDVALRTTSPTGSYSVAADGTHTWGSNILKRLSTTAMEFVGRLTLRGGAILLARAASPESEKLLSLQSNGGTELAYLTGTGKLFADNWRFGTGSPEGIVTAPRGTVYVDESTPATGGLWQKSTSTGNTGWLALKYYNATESALPVGTLIPWLGTNSDTLPAGTILANGAGHSTGGANTELFNLIQYRFGGSGSIFNIPDLRGKYLIGHSGAVGAAVGDSVGTTDGQVTLNVANLPPHRHSVIDPGHDHPQAGPYWYYRSNIHHNNRHPWPSTSLVPPHLWVEEGVDKTARTGITLGNTGSGQSFDALPPSVAINWLIKR